MNTPKKPAASLVLEHQAWRARMASITRDLQENPHRQERDSGRDGHFRHGLFIEGVARSELDRAFGDGK